MLFNSWLPLLILITLPYLVSILLITLYFVFNKNKKQIKISDYIQTHNEITVTKRKFHQLSSICKKTNSLRLYSSMEKNVGLLSMCFFLKKLYFYKKNKQATFSLINSLFTLFQLLFLMLYLLIFLSDKLNINFLKNILEDMKKQDGSYDRLTGGIIFIVYLNIFITYLMWVYGSNLYAYMYEEIIRYYDQKKVSYSFKNLRIAILVFILIDFLLLHLVFLRETYLNIKDIIVSYKKI